MRDLEGKAALVTGGSRGIGAAIVTQLAEAGASVAFTYVKDSGRAETLVAGLREAYGEVVAIRADSGDADALRGAVSETAETFGRLDILVNNAGTFPYGEPGRFTLSEIDRALAVHARAPFIAVQAALPFLGRSGRIISIGSCMVERIPVAGLSLYAMTKSALTGMTRGLARDLGPRGITVNIVHPGPVNTDMNPADAPAADEERALTALGRYAEPQELAATVLHLASASGRYITGAAITVDGGYAA